MIKVYNSSLTLVAILENAFNIGYDKRYNEIWTAKFSLPLKDSKNSYCIPFNFVEIYDENERVDIFRILPSKKTKSESADIMEYSCEHVFATLLDDLLFQYYQSVGNTTGYNINYILTFQSSARWVFGSCDFSATYSYKWENENLLSALFGISKALPSEYQWTWDTLTYPWTLNLTAPPITASSTIRYAKNLIGITKEEDPTSIITRIYPLGYGEGINQLTIHSVNSGSYSLDASTLGTYGIISEVFLDKSEEDATTLKAKASAYLEQVKNPKVTYSVEAADIYSITLNSQDNLREVGNYVTVIDEDLGTISARLVGISKPDLIGSPGDIKLEITNKVMDSSDTISSLQRKQRITESYSQGAVNIDSNDYEDNCDSSHPAVIKFYLPSETVRVNKCLLNYETSKFRAYETSLAAGGGTTVTSAAGGNTTVTSSASSTSTTDSGGGTTATSGGNDWYSDPGYTSGFSVTSADGAHNHGISGGAPVVTSIDFVTPSYWYYTFSAEGDHTHAIVDVNHSHDVTIANHSHGMAHTHGVTIPSHTHNVTIPSHTHGINFGIYEYSASATSITLTVDGVLVTAITTLSASDVNLIPYLSVDGDGKIERGAWHTIQITPNNLARLTVGIIKQIFVQSRGGGDY